MKRTSPHRPICRGNGLTGCTRGIRPGPSCSTWIPWRSERCRLEWALRLHLLPSAVCVQPVRRSGTQPISSRQRPQSRQPARRSATRRRALPGTGPAPLFPRRCRLRRTGRFRRPRATGIRSVGHPPDHMIRTHAGFSHQAGSWDRKRRVVARVERHPGERVPRVGFIVTRLSRPAGRVVAFCNRRGTAGQHIKEGRNAIVRTRLSCRRFRNTAVRLRLHALACNPGNFMRTKSLPPRAGDGRRPA